MLVQRTVLTAAIGKGLQLRPLMEEQIRARQARGQRVGLSRNIVGDGYQFVVTAIFENLAAVQARIEENDQDAGIQNFMDRTSPLLGARSQSVIANVLIQPPAPAFEAKFSHRFALTPAVGKQAEMEQILTERLTGGPAITAALASVIVGGPQQLIVTVFYASLADADALQAATLADPTWLPFTAKLAAVSGANPTVDLAQVLVPVQPAEIRELAGAATR